MSGKDNSRSSWGDWFFKTHPSLEKEREREALSRLEWPFRRRSILVQLLLFGIVLVLWQLPLINPIKLLVVLFHELSHVATAYLTGGIVFGIAIDPGGAGVTLGMGGNEFLILAAGYVGSFVLGCLLYLLSATFDPADLWAGLCGLCCASLFFGWLNEFSAVFGFGAIFLMVLGYLALSAGAKKFFLRLIATASCLYPVIDVAGEVLKGEIQGFMVQGKEVGSDVAQLALMTEIPESFIAMVWIMAGLVAVCVLVGWTSQKDAESSVKRRLFRPRLRMQFEHRLYDRNDPSGAPEYRLR